MFAFREQTPQCGRKAKPIPFGIYYRSVTLLFSGGTRELFKYTFDQLPKPFAGGRPPLDVATHSPSRFLYYSTSSFDLGLAFGRFVVISVRHWGVVALLPQKHTICGIILSCRGHNHPRPPLPLLLLPLIGNNNIRATNEEDQDFLGGGGSLSFVSIDKVRLYGCLCFLSHRTAVVVATANTRYSVWVSWVPWLTNRKGRRPPYQCYLIAKQSLAHSYSNQSAALQTCSTCSHLTTRHKNGSHVRPAPTVHSYPANHKSCVHLS